MFLRNVFQAEADSEGGGGSVGSAPAASNVTQGSNAAPASKDPTVSAFFARIDAAEKAGWSPYPEGAMPPASAPDSTQGSDVASQQNGDSAVAEGDQAGKTGKPDATKTPPAKPSTPSQGDVHSTADVDSDSPDDDSIRLAVGLGVPEAQARGLDRESLELVLSTLLSARYPHSAEEPEKAEAQTDATASSAPVEPEQKPDASQKPAESASLSDLREMLAEANDNLERVLTEDGYGETGKQIIAAMRAKDEAIAALTDRLNAELAEAKKEQLNSQRVRERERVNAIDYVFDEVCPPELFGTREEYTPEQGANAVALAQRVMEINQRSRTPITPALIRTAMRELFGPQLANIDAGRKTARAQSQSRKRMGVVRSGSGSSPYSGPPERDPDIIRMISDFRRQNGGY